ncbi:hypothetical protein K1T71_003365 [Dendrolimus kikuchii]|uniref:Uncharacterized protein n=1 Tax=Dendrolimus kikuchii TaxID=765133 RepID=A0ACC1DBS8_9NEOP|nr:hypothetical protein K1T71_003365 [Dendrolimus kikuchii]
MAAKSKKRLSKIENKLLNLEKLELKDVLCSICQSILTEPVTLPCFHDFCHRCFNGSIQNNALCCPLCRLRIGSWLRTATKKKNLINLQLWNFIKTKFCREIDTKTNGGEINIPEEKHQHRLSNPGEIRIEYEAELQRLRGERLRLEEKHIQETELLIRKIQEEEEEAHRKYLECLKKDEMLAHQIQHDHLKTSAPPCNSPRKTCQKGSRRISRLRPTKIDSYLSNFRQSSFIKDSPLLTNENTSSGNESAHKISTNHQINGASPEMVPSYGKSLKSTVDKKSKVGSGLWNKENGESHKEKSEDAKCHVKDVIDSVGSKDLSKSKSLVPSLLVSLPLPYTGIRPKNATATENRNLETGSVDSMHQELCYFKPIEGTPTSFSSRKSLPIRVPVLKAEGTPSSQQHGSAPSRAQYLQGLYQLRNISIARNLPSAFAIALSALKVQEKIPAICETNVKPKDKKISSSVVISVAKKTTNKNKTVNQDDGISTSNTRTNLRRTRSMGSITKDENETTPKKAKVKQRKVCSERKPYLRSDSKRNNRTKCSPMPISGSLNDNKVNLAVKNLSSPLESCDVKKILEEQLRIEKLIEQEKSDLELARKMDAEWNGRRQPRRAAGKRQLTLPHHLRPAKKLKV